MPLKFCRPGHLRSQFKKTEAAEPELEPTEEPEPTIEQQPTIVIPPNYRPAIQQAQQYCSGEYPKPLTAEDYAKEKAKGWLAVVKREIQETIDDLKGIQDLPIKIGSSLLALALVLITYSHIQANEQQQRAISNPAQVWAVNPDR